MPSPPPTGSLLALSASFDLSDSIDTDLGSATPPQRPPHCWRAWQERTGITPDANPLTPDFNPHSHWEDAKSSNAVWTFASNFWAMTEQEQTSYIRRQTDNDSEGRTLWISWVTSSWKQWRINETIEETLAERGFDPYTVMKRLKLSSVCLPLQFIAGI
jgi:hypothetical protein